MNLFSSPSFSLQHWVIGKGILFTLLGLLALDGGLCITSAFALSGVTTTPFLIAFTGTVGPGPLTIPVSFNNPGTTPVSFTWSDSIPWITAGHPAGTLTPGQSQTFTIKANIAGLVAGSYSGFAIVTAGGITQQIPVTLALSAATAPPIIGMNPSSLTFTGIAGGANPSSQSIGISNTGGGTLTWTASDNAPWLTLTPASGTNAGAASATVNLSGLAAGSYSGTISVTATGTATKTLPVTLTVANSSSIPGVTITPSPVTFTGTVGPGPLTIPVTFRNSGTTPVSFAWTDSIPWITAGHPAGTLTPGQSQTFTITANIAPLVAGSYNGIATVTAAGIAKQVPISLTLSAATAPVIGPNTTSLGFSGTVGGTNPSAQTIGISNIGGGTLSWTAGDNATWLTLSPLSGTNAGTITASVNLTGLLSGSYTATITVTATGATAKTIPVTLAVMASTSKGTIGFSPTNLAFSGTVGGSNPAAQPFTITNPGGGTLTWAISSNAAWLRLNTTSGTTTIETDTVSASVTTSGLAAGTYNAVLTVTASGSTNSPRQIPVSLTLSATVAGTVSLTWKANSETDLSGYKVYKGTSSGAYAAPVATLPKTTTSYTLAGLQTGTTYFFTITAYDNSGNESLHSAEVSKSIF